VGVTDGGLREGTARLNWAMPAYDYVPRLLTSTDTKPGSRSMQVNLYSSTTTVDVEATEEEQIKELEQEAQENTINNGDQSISKTWTASFKEIIETMTVEDKNDIMDIVQTYKIDMSDAWFDVYEDFETGATITIPAGEDFAIEDGFFYVTNADATIESLSLPYNEVSYEAAKNAITLVLEEFQKSGTWVEDPDSPDEMDADDEYEYASFDATRTSNDGTNQILSYHAEVNGSDLLVVLLLINGEKLEDPNYIKQVVHFGVAAELATFAEE